MDPVTYEELRSYSTYPVSGLTQPGAKLYHVDLTVAGVVIASKQLDCEKDHAWAKSITAVEEKNRHAFKQRKREQRMSFSTAMTYAR